MTMRVRRFVTLRRFPSVLTAISISAVGPATRSGAGGEGGGLRTGFTAVTGQVAIVLVAR
jgi:hypothetical protein